MQEAKNLELNGLKFTINNVPPTKLARNLPYLIGKISPIFTAFAEAEDDMEVSDMFRNAGPLLMQIDPDDVDKIANLVLSTTKVEYNGALAPVVGTGNVTDIVFQGKVKTYFQLIWEALAHNYADFLDGLGGK